MSWNPRTGILPDTKNVQILIGAGGVAAGIYFLTRDEAKAESTFVKTMYVAATAWSAWVLIGGLS